MPSFFSSSDIAIMTGAMGNHFDSFSNSRTRLATIYKEPIKIINNLSSKPSYGYDENSNATNITYVPVTGIFPAILTYTLKPDADPIDEAKYDVIKSNVRMKVEKPARDFIQDGRANLRVDFDSRSYNIVLADAEVQNFLGLVYYIYKLEGTN